MPFESYTRAQEIQARIVSEISDGTFDPSRYMRKLQTVFYAHSNLETYMGERRRRSYRATFAHSESTQERPLTSLK